MRSARACTSERAAYRCGITQRFVCGLPGSLVCNSAIDFGRNRAVPQQIKGCPFRNMEASSSTAAAHGDATFAPGARVIYKDGSSGVVQKAHHDDPEGVYYTVDLGPGRVINALHKSLRPQEAVGAAVGAAAGAGAASSSESSEDDPPAVGAAAGAGAGASAPSSSDSSDEEPPAVGAAAGAGAAPPSFSSASLSNRAATSLSSSADRGWASDTVFST